MIKRVCDICDADVDRVPTRKIFETLIISISFEFKNRQTGHNGPVDLCIGCHCTLIEDYLKSIKHQN